MTTGRHRVIQSGHNETSLRVLVVVPSAARAKHLVEMLNQAVCGSVRLSCADRLSVAMQWLHHETYDLALLDPVLPDARGVDPIGMLLEQQPTMPVLVIARSQADALKHNALHPGARAYLAGNSLDLETLRDSLVAAACLESRQSSRTGVDIV